MKARSWILAGALTMGSCVVPVGAEVLSYEFRGTVDAIHDSVGLFGAAEGGDPFTLTYFADFSVGSYNGAAGGFGASNWLIGGSSFEPDPFYPTIQESPVSAVLEVNGHELEFLGTFYGQVRYTQNWLPEQFGGQGTSWAEFTAAAPGSQITSSLFSDFSTRTFGSIDTLGSLLVDGSSIHGSTSFSYHWAEGTAQEALLSGSLTATSFSVTPAIPEPQSWILLTVGLAGLIVRRSKPASSQPRRAL